MYYIVNNINTVIIVQKYFLLKMHYNCIHIVLIPKSYVINFFKSL